MWRTVGHGISVCASHFLPVLLLAIVLSTAPSFAAQRVALVIGNGLYRHTTPLKNPSNDAADMAATLHRLGFDVTRGLDLDKSAMELVIRQFANKLAGAKLALFFYAGHAVQISGENYLLPIDSRLGTEIDAEFETVPLHVVLKQLERQARTSVIVLDACRDNPLARSLRTASRSTQINQGLAETRGGVDMLIAFSTKPGDVALDGTARNSPYTEALLKHVETPGKDVIATLRAVRNDVYQATNGRQVPWDHNSLLHDLILSEANPPAALPGPQVVSYRQEWEKNKQTLGSFKRLDDRRWVEVVQTWGESRSTSFFFDLRTATEKRILLLDQSRGMWVRLELEEKRVYWSNDEQRTWKYIYEITDLN